ncbi:hypothetical protein [Cupriavidus sp. AcVe19-1a]|uniref:hypothetical protein n=1 Tax=Cupriavidus sp. AcVe19-1a TaxID=2821359 RepID=UPI001AE6F464|nr:hypothetical protein [Cupriavidus sp. AcVe19-1a]MBP0628057.1 hypothetical protein [Cupriavidus sp. AcVe19-1a]
MATALRAARARAGEGYFSNVVPQVRRFRMAEFSEMARGDPLQAAKKKRRSEPAQLSTTEKEEKSGTAREVSHPSRASNGGKRYLFL